MFRGFLGRRAFFFDILFFFSMGPLSKKKPFDWSMKTISAISDQTMNYIIFNNCVKRGYEQKVFT